MLRVALLRLAALTVAALCVGAPAYASSGGQAPAAGPDPRAALEGYDRLLFAAVRGAEVDYDAVLAKRQDLRAFLAFVARKDAAELKPGPARLAFYTNAYNALVLEAVLTHGRPTSVLDVKGFFDAARYRVAGESLTLNELEEHKIRGFGDPRVHFVVNCASKSCPPLAPAAYTAEGWEVALEAQTRAFLRRPGEVILDEAKKTVTVSKLFEWYRKDWGEEAAVRRFLARYMPERAAKLTDPAYSLVTREYDWTLNAAHVPSATR